jgi:predicted dehydrogenase
MQHLKAFASIGTVDVIAIPLRSERRAELEQAGFAFSESLEKAVANGASAVVIATDTKRHVDDARKAIELGCGVLIEKPAAPSANEGLTILHAATSRASVFVGCVLRFSESLNQFRKKISELGEVHTVRIECQSYLPDWRPQRAYRDSYSARVGEGGVLLDLIHEIDYAGWLFGWPEQIQARLGNLGRLGIATEESADLLWQTTTGAEVSIHLDYVTRPPRRVMRACGEAGTLEWDGIANVVRFLHADGAVEESKSQQTRGDMFQGQARAFVESIKGESLPSPATLMEGIRALAVCDAARQSSANRCEETVRYP